jgi:uncharacterized protein YyaL (SSP411 family)
MANRLKDATSPYLLQHKDNPVDWWPWCPEAFEEARRRDVPILLSVGYAACHWCHVMAHESFEDESVATLMNNGFVNIKVDREERPDVDAVYMEATQAMTGQGGWPMTCLLTADGHPFFCGTYFPRAQFSALLGRVIEVWQEQREAVVNQAADVARQLAESAQRPPVEGEITTDLLDVAVRNLVGDVDQQHGGFGGAPKFPPSMVLEFLLRSAARTGDLAPLQIVERTCEAMARGGIYDQLAGGFARYSVDAAWIVPHFEKMLYDNALLLRVYAHLWRATGSSLAERVVRETASFLMRDLRTDQGGFASALDADADGREGLTYVWTPQQLTTVLGDADGAWAAEQFTVTTRGTFEEGASVLQRLTEPDDLQRYEQVRARLLAARADRPQPARDDKVVTAWNGLAIAALADAGALLGEPSWVTAAEEAARLLRDLHVEQRKTGVRVVRTSRDGVSGGHAGVLEDYGDLAEGLLALHQVTGDMQWFELAGLLLDTVLEHFPDGQGGFYDVADDAEQLLRRPQDPSDNATPSGASAVTGALVTHAALTGSERHRSAAARALAQVSPLFLRHVRFAGWAAAVGEALVAGPAEVAVVDRPDLERVARLGTAPGAVVVTAGPLTEGRDRPGVYVCRNFVCALPADTAEQVRAQLGGLAGLS